MLNVTVLAHCLPSQRRQDDLTGLLCNVSGRFYDEIIKNVHSQFTFIDMVDVVNQSAANKQPEKQNSDQSPPDIDRRHLSMTNEDQTYRFRAMHELDDTSLSNFDGSD